MSYGLEGSSVMLVYQGSTMRNSENSVLDEFFDLLKSTPIWFRPILAAVVYIVFRFVMPPLLPSVQGGLDVRTILRPMCVTLAPVLAGGVILAWIFAEGWKLINRR